METRSFWSLCIHCHIEKTEHIYGCLQDAKQTTTTKQNPRANKANEMQQTCSKTRTWQLSHFFILPKKPAQTERHILFSCLCVLFSLHLESLGLLTHGIGPLKTKDCFVWPGVFINICIVNFIILQSTLSHERGYTKKSPVCFD